MGARSKRPSTCNIGSHGVSAKAFQIPQLAQAELCPAVHTSTAVRYDSTTVGNTCHCRAMGSGGAIICSEFRKGEGATRIKSMKSWRQGAFWKRNGDESRRTDYSTSSRGGRTSSMPPTSDRFAAANARVQIETVLSHAHMAIKR